MNQPHTITPTMTIYYVIGDTKELINLMDSMGITSKNEALVIIGLLRGAYSISDGDPLVLKHRAVELEPKILSYFEKKEKEMIKENEKKETPEFVVKIKNTLIHWNDVRKSGVLNKDELNENIRCAIDLCDILREYVDESVYNSFIKQCKV